MAVSTRPIEHATPIETPGVVEHGASAKRYSLTRSVQRRTTLAGEDVFERTATHTIGSGKNARTYVHRGTDGLLSQLPISWYTQEKRWAMSPGYDVPNHPDFARVIEPGCLFCHTSYPVAGAAQPTLEAGIDCQRCHGPGSDHAKAPTKTNILRYSGMDVCLQCHLQSTSNPLPHAVLRLERDVYSYRPEEKLSAYAVHFDYPPDIRAKKFEINSHGARLLQSPCFGDSAGELDCIKCHDPHGEESESAVRERTRSACLNCHGAHPDSTRIDCAKCHMPSRRTQDAVHVVMTDHRISREALADSKAPLAERHERYVGPLAIMRPDELPSSLHPLYLGVAYLQGGANVQLGLDLLRQPRGLPNAIIAEIVKILSAEGQTELAVQWIRRASGRLSPKDHLAFGEALLRANRLDEANVHLRLALPLPKAHMGLAFAALKQNRSTEAAERWQAASDHPQTRAEALANLSALYFESGDIDKATRTAAESLAFEPNGADANSVYSRALAAKGEFAKATQRAKRAIAFNPEHPLSRYNYGRLLHRAGKREEAIGQYSEALRFQPELYGAHLSLGVAYGEAGAYLQAAEHFRMALKLKPDLREAQQNLEVMEELLLKAAKARGAIP